MKARTCNSVRTDNFFATQPAKPARDGLRSAVELASMLAVGVFLLCGLPLFAQDNPKPVVQQATAFAVSAPLRELAKLPAQPQYGFHDEEPFREMYRRPVNPVVDTVEQTAAGPASNFSTGLNVMGVGNGFPNYVVDWPRPMTSMAVGDTQLVQWVANSYAVFDKMTGNPLSAPIDSGTLFASLELPCSYNSTFSASVHWDKAAHRWLIARNSDWLPYTTCVAVSTSSDALGSYYLFAYDQHLDPNAYTFLAKWGVWNNGYYKSEDIYQDSTYLGANLCGYNRTKLIAGDSSAEEVCFPLSANDFSPTPADLDSSVPPPSGQDIFFAAAWDQTHLALYSLHADFANPNNSFVTGNNGSQLVQVPAFTPACNGSWHGYCVPQKGTNAQLEVLGGRLGNRIAYWDDTPPASVKANPPIPVPSQHWYVVHDSTANGGNEAPRWYEFAAPQRKVSPTSLTLFQSGTFAPDANHRWMAGIARDKRYNMLMGYNISSTTMYPSIAITGRTLHDPLGTMEGEVMVVNGLGSQTESPGEWGAYSALKIDQDGCTFFHINEYYLLTAVLDWSTQIVSAKFDNCQ